MADVYALNGTTTPATGAAGAACRVEGVLELGWLRCQVFQEGLPALTGKAQRRQRLGQRRFVEGLEPLHMLQGSRLVQSTDILGEPVTLTYTCVDRKGNKRSSDRPIPECNDREQRVLNKDGS
jgi:hypothetical protein